MKILNNALSDFMNKKYDFVIYDQLNCYMQDDPRNIPYIKQQLYIQLRIQFYKKLNALLRDQLILESQTLVTEGNSLYSV